MVFVLLFLFSGFIHSQNIFLVSASTEVSNIRDVVIDKNIKINFEDMDDKKFTFENLLINQQNVNEEEIKEIEESGEGEELQGFNMPSLVEPPPVNLGGDGKIKIRRKDTGETGSFYYRNKDGSYNEDEVKRIRHIMRCSLDDSEIKVPLKLLELLDAIQDRFGKNKEIVLLSGYRTKPLNDITPGAAKKSLHILGWAADIRIDGVSSRRIRDFARKLKIGGVGYYPRYGYVHVDIGRARYWEKYQYSKKRNIAKNRRHRSKYSKSLSESKTQIKKFSAVNKSNFKKVAWRKK